MTRKIFGAILAASMALLAATAPATAADVPDWDTSAANNNAAPPDGFPEGMAPSAVNDAAREVMAAVRRWYGDAQGTLVLGGTGAAYTLTTNAVYTALADLPALVVEVNTDNTGAATLAVDALTAKDIKMPDGGDPPAGTLKDGAIVILVYEDGADDFILVAGSNLGDLAQLDRVDTIDQDLALTGDISPSQITATQDDYNPSGLATASTLRLSSDASRTITGLAGGADGRLLVLHNVGSNNIVLSDEGAGSSAANRFALPGDLTLEPDVALLLQYDSTGSRWRAAGRIYATATASAAGVVEQATEAELEAETADKYADAALMKHHPGVAKFWVKFDGQTAAIDASYNITSVVRNSSGNYTITIDTDFASANWAVVSGAGLLDTGQEVPSLSVVSQTAGTVVIRTENNSGGDTDLFDIYLAGFGAQ